MDPVAVPRIVQDAIFKMPRQAVRYLAIDSPRIFRSSRGTKRWELASTEIRVSHGGRCDFILLRPLLPSTLDMHCGRKVGRCDDWEKCGEALWGCLNGGDDASLYCMLSTVPTGNIHCNTLKFT